MQRLGRGRKQPHGLSSEVQGLEGAAAVGGTRYRVTGTAVRGRTARACREASCPRWAEGRLGGDNEARQSKAGAGWEPGRSRVVKGRKSPYGGWLTQQPAYVARGVENHELGECPGHTCGTAHVKALPALGYEAKLLGGRADLTHLRPGPGTGS